MAGLKPTVPKRLEEEGVQIISCVDNDDKVRKFEKENGFIRPDGIKKVLDDKGFKDWNELLVFQTEHPNSIFDKDFHKSDIEEKSLAETTQDVMAENIQNEDDDIEEMGGMTM